MRLRPNHSALEDAGSSRAYIRICHVMAGNLRPYPAESSFRVCSRSHVRSLEGPQHKKDVQQRVTVKKKLSTSAPHRQSVATTKPSNTARPISPISCGRMLPAQIPGLGCVLEVALVRACPDRELVSWTAGDFPGHLTVLSRVASAIALPSHVPQRRTSFAVGPTEPVDADPNAHES